jgi:hypothetical protein
MQPGLSPFKGGFMDSSYEFSAEQNQVIGRTGGRVRLWGILSLFAAVLMLLGGLLSATIAPVVALIYLAAALIPLFVGLAFMRAGKALKAVTTTEGHDVALLMDAMDNLARAFGIQLVASLAWFALIVIAFISAIAIPMFADTKVKAYEMQQLADLNDLTTAQTKFFSDSSRYASDVRSRRTRVQPQPRHHDYGQWGLSRLDRQECA